MSEDALRIVSDSVLWSWSPAVFALLLSRRHRRTVAACWLAAALASAAAGLALHEAEDREARKLVTLVVVRLSSVLAPVAVIVRAGRPGRGSPRGAGVHCGTCGYNLIGNVSGACPECGTRVPWRQAGPPTGPSPSA